MIRFLPTWLNASAVRDHLRLALPLCAAHMGIQLMALVDIAMVGRFSEASLAGSGIGANYVFVIAIFGAGILMGVDSFLPKELGKQSHERAKGYFCAGVSLSKRLALPLMAVLACGPWLLSVTSVDAAVRAEAIQYLWPRLLGVFPYLLFFVQRSYLQALGLTRPIVIVVIAANILNVILDGLLIHGDGGLEAVGLPGIGLPALGSMGAGLATSLVSVAICLWIGLTIKKATRHIQAEESPQMTRDILSLGLPIGGQMLVECGIFGLTGFLSGRMGEVPAAAHQIALALAAMSFSSALGIAAATSVKVGLNIGRDDPQAAKQSGYLGITLGTIIMGCAGILFVVFPDPLAKMFSDAPKVTDLAVKLLMIAAIFQLSDAVQAIGAGALRGLGETRATFVANAWGHYGVGLPLAVFLAFHMDMGAEGLWWGLSAGLTMVAIFLVRRFSVAV